MSEKVLFVDDEPAVLDGYKRILHREFEVDTALGGQEGLKVLEQHGPFAVVISDMRMPEMDGVQFLSQVRQLFPETVRMVLTGYADISAAMDAVNEGSIFRFLTKPCDKAILAKAVTTGFVQYRLVVAERELLENTLMGSIKVLTDVLSLVNPAAFGRSVRVTRSVRHMVRKLKLKAGWRFEAAAMLSQLGCVTLEPEVIEAAYAGKELPPADHARLNAHPRVARELLSNIPRLEPIAWMISQQQGTNGDQLPDSSGLPTEVIVLGAKMLKVAIAWDNLKMKGRSPGQAMEELRGQPQEFDPKLVQTLTDVEPAPDKLQPRAIKIASLVPGMILQQEVRTQGGMLLAEQGQEVSHPLLIRLNSFLQRRAIGDTVSVLVAEP